MSPVTVAQEDGRMPEDPEVVEPQEPTPPKGQEPPKPEEPEIEVVEEDTPNPLQPGGVRFEQVYAEKKQAEELAQRLAAEKARLEAQLATHQQQPPPQQQPTEREYTEDELDALEQQAQLRGDRNGLRAINNYRVQRQIKATLAEERQRQAQTSVGQNVGSQLFTIYKDLTDPASDLYKASANEYVEVVKEYAAMGRDAGKDPYATELAVSRAIRKNPELAKKTIAPKREVESEPGPVSDDQPVKPNKIVAKLTKRELDFCRRSGQDPKEYAKWRRERAAR